MEKRISLRTFIAIGIGAALFFVVGYFVKVPTTIPNTYATAQYAIQAVFAVIFGPIAGLLTGFIGHTLIDLAYGGPWWSWIIASGVFGLFVGLFSKIINISNGEFSIKNIIIFNIVQIFGHIIAWAGVAPILDFLIYSEPKDKLFAQSAFAVISNSLLTGIIATIILIAYSKTIIKKGSLKKFE